MIQTFKTLCMCVREKVSVGEGPGPQDTEHVWRSEGNLNVSPSLLPCVPGSLCFSPLYTADEVGSQVSRASPVSTFLLPRELQGHRCLSCAWLYVGSWASTSDPQPCMASGLFLTSPLQPSTFHELICRCNILGPPIASVIGVFITVSRTWSHLPYFKSL